MKSKLELRVLARRLGAVSILGIFLTALSWAADNPATPRLHPLEKFCVTSKMEGIMQGTWTECSRDYAYERYELQETEIKFGPISQKDSQHVIYLGNKIYTIRANGQKTVADNPMFAATVSALEDSDPMALADKMLANLGYAKNGQTMTILDLTCDVAAGPLGSICMTENGITLYLETMGNTRTATRVDLESGGDDANYEAPADAQQAPSLDDITKMMQGLSGGQNQQ